MNLKFVSCSVPFTLYLLWGAAASGQAVTAAPTIYAGPQSVEGNGPAVVPQGGPVSYASVTQLNGLLEQLEAGTDARAERYWQLLGIINGWPPFQTHVPAFEWMIAALRAHP